MNAKRIDPKGISVGGGSNGAPYVEKKSSLPTNAARPDRGEGLKKGPAPVRDNGKESRSMSVKQKSSSVALKTSRPGGLKKY